MDEENEVDYETGRGRKKKHQHGAPRHPATIVFHQCQYQRLKKYAFDNNMSISDVLIEIFARMTGET